MNFSRFSFRHYAFTAWGVVCLMGMYLLKQYSYLLFHSAAEMFSIVIVCSIFLIAWNSRRFMDNNYVLFLGVAYLFIAGLDALHTFAYKGMGVFPDYGSNLSTQLWITARYMEAFSLFLAPFFIYRRPRPWSIFFSNCAVTALLLGTIFYWKVFPTCYVEPGGLTRFKIASEYLICVILLSSLFSLLKKKNSFDRNVLSMLAASIAVTVGSEFLFTLYVDVYGVFNFAGHLLKIASFYFIYKALIQASLVNPYSLLFRKLKQSQEMLNKNRKQLEKRVDERTRELSSSNQRLKQEIAERRKAEQALRQSEKKLRILSARVLEFQEEERKRIAMDLHDSTCQTLARIKYGIQDVIGKMDHHSTAKEHLGSLIPMIQQAIDGTREIIKNLRPSILDHLGIRAAVESFCEEFQEVYSHIQVVQHIDVSEEQVPEQLKIVIYRIIQEAFSNIAKYSRADLVQVFLKNIDSHLELLIKDNGVGFNPDMVFTAVDPGGGVGLVSMRERAQHAGGHFEVSSSPGKGVTIQVILPAGYQGTCRQ
ncbi:MAG: MASE3 domain-containing protein [Spirochaetota bacterium]